MSNEKELRAGAAFKPIVPSEIKNELSDYDKIIIDMIDDTFEDLEYAQELKKEIIEKLRDKRKKKYSPFEAGKDIIIIHVGGSLNLGDITEEDLKNLLDKMHDRNFDVQITNLGPTEAHNQSRGNIINFKSRGVTQSSILEDGTFTGKVLAQNIIGLAEIDLSDYYTKEQIDEMMKEKVSFSDIIRDAKIKEELLPDFINDRLTALEEKLNYTPPALTMQLVGYGSGTIIKKKGTEINAPTVKIGYVPGYIEKCTLEFKEISIDNGITIQTLNFNVTKNDLVKEKQISVSSFKNSRQFTSKISDGKQNVSRDIYVKFVYPMFTHAVPSMNTVIDETFIKSGREDIREKGQVTSAFNLDNSRILFTAPASYGYLTSITDQNGFEILPAFKVTTINMKMDDGIVVPYNVYTATTPASAKDFKVTFKY